MVGQVDLIRDHGIIYFDCYLMLDSYIYCSKILEDGGVLCSANLCAVLSLFILGNLLLLS